VKRRVTNRGSVDVDGDVTQATQGGVAGVVGGRSGRGPALKRDQTVALTLPMTVPSAPAFSRPYFSRASLVESRYTILDPASLHRPASMPAFLAHVQYSVAGVPVDIRVPVTRREAQLPYGYVMRELAVVPALALTVSPRQAIVPQASSSKTVRLQVELTNNAPAGSHGQLALKLPAGWKAEPSA